MKKARDMTVAEIADSAYQGLLDLSTDKYLGSPPDLSNPWHLHTLRFPGIENGQQSEPGGPGSYPSLSYTVLNMSRGIKNKIDKVALGKICDALDSLLLSERFNNNSSISPSRELIKRELVNLKRTQGL